MDPWILVTNGIEDGRKLLAALDEAGVCIDVALWLYSERYDRWRLAFSSPQFDERGHLWGYATIRSAIGRVDSAVDFNSIDTGVTILDSTQSPIPELRMHAAEGFDLTGQWLRDTYVNRARIDAAYIFRVKPAEHPAGAVKGATANGRRRANGSRAR